ncbi:uncharacterized protein LOC112346933 [Selaginella moellendorffii]|uniref:uncharacterized protein LOC112346933 n=1 Tax=Selaginella moellendorffii TaxID=88036 RepID=UPI000D1C4663|nr:uncharacterized protein LOC112346933 [Selaginella moellendorffii]|eukprot:XP_024532668.1 uncharacterized protein LOC112346933 [Selaginella moellendorffii]
MVGKFICASAAAAPQERTVEEPHQGAVSMKYWDDWADPQDMDAMWSHPEINKEWIAAGEIFGKKVHMLRDPDGRPYITQTELQAIAEILVKRHFRGKISQAMICAVAEIESQRHPLAYTYNSRIKDVLCGLMKMRKSTVEWLSREKDYGAYAVDWKTSMLFKPFVGVYYGAAYLSWLSSYEGKRKTEEFIVRAYHSGPKDANSKQSLAYWNKYLSAKQSLPTRWDIPNPHNSPPPVEKEKPSIGTAKKLLYETSPGRKWIYWEEKTSPEDMSDMWRHPELRKEWTRTGEKPGKVRFSLDGEMRPHLKKVELKAVAEIIVAKYFSDRGMSPAMLCTIAEISSKRLLFGTDTGIMQTPFSTAAWLYTNLGYKSYKLKSAEDLTKPFVSMYFGAAYVCWLSTHGGRTRSDQFIVQSYRGGPQKVESSEAGPFWLKYIDNLPQYLTNHKTRHAACCIQ